jgi:hypothetical protein
MRSEPPWDFFHDASIASLQSFELSRLNNAANIRRQVAALLDQWVSDNSQALLARWVREERALPQSADPQTKSLPENGVQQAELLFETSARPVLLPRRAERPHKAIRAHRR